MALRHVGPGYPLDDGVDLVFARLAGQYRCGARSRRDVATFELEIRSERPRAEVLHSAPPSRGVGFTRRSLAFIAPHRPRHRSGQTAPTVDYGQANTNAASVVGLRDGSSSVRR